MILQEIFYGGLTALIPACKDKYSLKRQKKKKKKKKMREMNRHNNEYCPGWPKSSLGAHEQVCFLLYYARTFEQYLSKYMLSWTNLWFSHFRIHLSKCIQQLKHFGICCRLTSPIQTFALGMVRLKQNQRNTAVQMLLRGASQSIIAGNLQVCKSTLS